jgi:hypothetical protein
MARKPVSIKTARKKKQPNQLHKPLSYWERKLPGWIGLEHCNDLCSIAFPEGDDWKPYVWKSMWDMIIDTLRPEVAAILNAN